MPDALQLLKTRRSVKPLELLGPAPGAAEIETLLGLWRNQRRPSSKVKALALAHIAELDARIAELEAMKRTLGALADHCHGDDRPDCPILEGLAT